MGGKKRKKDKNQIIESMEERQTKRDDEVYMLRRYSEQSYDKLIVYFSAGGLYISITLFNEFIKQKIPINFCLVLYIWISYFLALFVNLISHKFAKYASDAHLTKNETNCIRYGLITEILNWFSLFLFITGSILFLIFIGVTFYGKQ